MRVEPNRQTRTTICLSVHQLRANAAKMLLFITGPFDGTETHWQPVDFENMCIAVWYPCVQIASRAESTNKNYTNYICSSAHLLCANAAKMQLFITGPSDGTETHWQPVDFENMCIAVWYPCVQSASRAESTNTNYTCLPLTVATTGRNNKWQHMIPEWPARRKQQATLQVHHTTLHLHHLSFIHSTYIQSTIG